ncbi:DsbA family protein [Leucobacter soli]|uniref:DSBA-like thioredoxin domain-containing protein n=1 Tax=Leucobacter soli TaxID=2812850 RepID=A0A916NH93_9MICO|nr:DsbA family oxidoreductase [Leucobacter soli]CAG7612735.1 hypothetical protein LEUCIP111803_01605 [Leucobacter soli]
MLGAASGAAPDAAPAAGSAAEPMPGIRVEVWFDVRCPWCFLGKHRLERAIELFAAERPGVPVAVRHLSFELAPEMPERFDGTEADYLQRYEGAPLEHSRRMLPELRNLAAAEGVELRFDGLRLVNTRRAHRVFQYGRAAGRGEELLERLFTAYFSECRDLADPGTLADLAAEAGLDRSAALAAAESGWGERWDEAVDADHTRAQMLGSGGVPFALLNGKYLVPGAQTAEVFAGALREVARRDFGAGAGTGRE